VYLASQQYVPSREVMQTVVQERLQKAGWSSVKIAHAYSVMEVYDRECGLPPKARLAADLVRNFVDRSQVATFTPQIQHLVIELGRDVFCTELKPSLESFNKMVPDGWEK